MVIFNTPSYDPPDKSMHESSDMKGGKSLEDPIIPMSELGATISEQVSNQKYRNLVQGVAADLRRGIGKLQIVMDVPHNQQTGGRAKSYGPETREKLREMIAANDAMIVGVELPTSLSNLSGMDIQQGTVSEDNRRKELDEVRDAIKFTADVAQGGSVDILSWEFPRALMDAEWNEKDNKWKGAFQIAGEKEHFEVQLVDKRTGAIARAPSKGIPNPLKKEEREKYKKKDDWRGNEVWDWDNFKEFAKTKGTNPYEEIKFALFNKQIISAEAHIARRESEIDDFKENLRRISEKKEEAKNAEDKDALKNLENKEERINKFIKSFQEEIEDQNRTIIEHKERQVNLVALPEFAKKNSIKSYAEAGLMAMEETHNNKHIKRPVYVGPEIGWPQFYGSHPDEFIDLIKEARKKMTTLLTKEYIEEDGKKVKNPHYDESLSREEAEEQAKLHIKGTFDTSHMGMWLERFKPNESWDTRREQFDKWYMEQVKKMAKEDVVGTIQLVNSMSAAHGHNPPGEGIFPVVKAAKEFKKQGFTGYFISEGHEEEKFGEGRIITKTWEAFNSPIETKYGPGPARTWNDINHGYFGRTYSPRMMFGSYTPPMAEYKPWAGGKNPVTFE